jgi:O-antigen/teichoic acid export membrane protein
MIAMATPIITIPLTLGYLGKEIYGLWMAVGSFIGMFVFADLGLGNGLLTSLSRASGKGDSSTRQSLVSTTAFLLSGAALALGVIFLALFPFLPWPTLFNATTASAQSTAEGVVAAIAVCFLVNLPLSTVQRTQMALQEGYQTNVWQAVGSIVGIGVVLLGVMVKLPAALLILTISGMPIVITAANWWWYFHRVESSLRPRLQCFSWPAAQALLRVGIGYFVISILMTLGMYADNLIIAHTNGLQAVTLYSVPARMGLILGAVVNMICAPMWTATGEALARGDLDWVRTNTSRLLRVSILLTSLSSLVLITFGPSVLRIWLGNDFEVSRWLLLGLGVSAVLTSASAPYFVVLNGAGVISPQVKIFLVFTPIVLTLKIALAKSFGPVGIPFANAACYAILVLPPAIFLTRSVFRKDPSGTEPSAIETSSHSVHSGSTTSELGSESVSRSNRLVPE